MSRKEEKAPESGATEPSSGENHLNHVSSAPVGNEESVGGGVVTDEEPHGATTGDHHAETETDGAEPGPAPETETASSTGGGLMSKFKELIA